MSFGEVGPILLGVSSGLSGDPAVQTFVAQAGYGWTDFLKLPVRHGSARAISSGTSPPIVSAMYCFPSSM